MLSDPQSITYNTVAKSLARISNAVDNSVYRLNDTAGQAIYTLTLQHQFKSRNRVVARLQRESIATDPLSASTNIETSMAGTFTLDFPNAGLTPVDAQYLGSALVAFLTSAVLLRLANGET